MLTELKERLDLCDQGKLLRKELGEIITREQAWMWVPEGLRAPVR